MKIINLLNIKQKKSNPIFDMKGNNVTDVFYDDKCSICFKKFKTKTILKKSTDFELQEVEIVTNHKKCDKLIKKMKKLQNDLLNCEFELFCSRTN